MLERVCARAKSEAKPPPFDGDLVTFLERANVIFLDENNRPVRFDKVIVAWEDG